MKIISSALILILLSIAGYAEEIKPLAGKVAIVTGAGRGIGRSIAETLADRGAKVIVTSRTKEQLDETVNLITEKGGIALAFAADVTNEEDVIKLVNTAVTHFGSLDIFVNNAGSFQWIGPLWEADTETWWNDVVVNLKGVFLCCRYAIPEMIKQRSGVIINLNGGGATDYLLYGNSYTSGKAGMLRMTEQIARELQDQNYADIMVYALHPGLVITEMTKYQANTLKGQNYIPNTKKCFDQGMVRPPTDCAKACAWLAENHPKEFSGRVFSVEDDFDELFTKRDAILKQNLRLLRLRE